MTALILSFIVILFIIYLLHRKPKKFPPGPIGIPFLGYGPLVYTTKVLPHICVANLKPRFGSLVSIPLGIKGHALVLNDWKAVKEAIIHQADVFAGRPKNFLLNFFFQQSDIALVEGQLWKDKRRFSLHHLRDFGFGKKSMESIMVEQVLEFLEANENSVINCGNVDFLFLPVLNVIWGIVAGKKYTSKDENMQKFSKTLQLFFQDFQNLICLNSLPLLRFVPGIRPIFLRCVKNREKIMAFARQQVLEHDQTYEEGSTRDFIDVYLAEINKQKKLAKPNPAFEMEQLMGVIFDFFGAGVETTKNTLMWAFLYMATWPEIQKKMQHELDSVIGREKIPNYSDRSRLPYTEAVLLEILRYSTIIPFSIPHSTMKETTFLGYTIPKNTFVLQNLWAVHNDKDCWGDPENFRPERFINMDGKVEKPEYLIPFSLGPRACLGEPLARMEIFLFFTTIMQRYSVNLPTGVKPPGLEPVLSISLHPQPYSLFIKKRF